ncbi:VCBS repeat-containing protein, partial [bacterium]|nr:VCBS repeat-containing protein [bacterium]
RESIGIPNNIQNPIYGNQDDSPFLVGMLYNKLNNQLNVSIEVVLGRQEESGNFTRVDSIGMNTIGAKFYQNNSTVVMAAPTVELDGAEYFSFGYMEFEEYTDLSTGTVYVAGKNSLAKVAEIKGYTDETSSYQLEGVGVPIYEQGHSGQKIDIFTVNGDTINVMAAQFSDDQSLRENFNFFDFIDLDADGKPDFIFYAINKLPLIYLNDGSFNFERVSTADIINNFDLDMVNTSAGTYRIDDFDNNGNFDLLALPGEWVRPENILFEATLIL